MSVKQIVMAAAGALGGQEATEAVFTATGNTSWVVPDGVTSISAVAIGGGGGGSGTTSGGSGGGGGDLRYYNNLSVTPGETLTITVGAGGTSAASGTAGGYSRIARSGTTLLEAAGGGGGTSLGGTGAKNGTSSTIGGSIGGGDGGTCAGAGNAACGGGGGAGGYSGDGGDAGNAPSTPGLDGSGGGGGGGGGGGDSDEAGPGGGVNVFGEGDNGIGGDGAAANGDSGTGGSYGDGGIYEGATGAASRRISNTFGGGAGGSDAVGTAGDGASGAVRIVWPGNERSFPSTDVWMSQEITTVIETQSSSQNIDIPASAQAGDLAVLMSSHRTTGAQTDPSGWTRITGLTSNDPVLVIWYRILQSGDPGTTVSTTSGTGESLEMVVLRKATGTFSSVTASGATIDYDAGIVPTQTQLASSANAPFIVFSAFVSTAITFATSDVYFTGGIAGSGNIEPSYSYQGQNGDASRQAFLRFRIYDKAPSADVSVVCKRDVSSQTMASFILEVN